MALLIGSIFESELKGLTLLKGDHSAVGAGTLHESMLAATARQRSSRSSGSTIIALVYVNRKRRV